MHLSFVQKTGKEFIANANMHCDSILNRVFLNRGVSDKNTLNNSIKALLPPDGLPEIENGAELLLNAIVNKKRIVVFCDYDVDGNTSACTLIKGIRMLGGEANYIVPCREKHGYGLTMESLELLQFDTIDLLITVDNGITSVGPVAHIKENYETQVIVTDHHLPLSSGEIPDADAVINPRLESNTFPSENLAGCGVAFYLIATCRRLMIKHGLEQVQGVSLLPLLDLVALGTIADLVEMDHNNRVIVQAGLNLIRSGQGSTGLKSLIEVAGLKPAKVSPSDLSFKVAPVLNAAGRLENMSEGIELLLCEDDGVARSKAIGLREVNEKRKSVERSMQEEAFAILKNVNVDEEKYSIVVGNSSWHQGVVGIVASRLKERYELPVLCFGGGKRCELKGSGRSIEGFHIKHEGLDVIHSESPELVSKYGGHAFAVGLTINESDLGDVEKAFEACVRKAFSSRPANVAYYDEVITEERVSVPYAKKIADASVWGKGFEEPVFYGRFKIKLSSSMRDPRHFKCVGVLEGGERNLNLSAFNKLMPGEEPPPVGSIVECSYKLGVSEYNGKESVIILIEKYQVFNGNSYDKK